jgi:hypothetical protein
MILLGLAIVCLMAAVAGACRKDVPTAVAGTTGAILFTLLAGVAAASAEDDPYREYRRRLPRD